ncbi:hypothetical protein, partial [Pseudomonas aeruginosa]
TVVRLGRDAQRQHASVELLRSLLEGVV